MGGRGSSGGGARGFSAPAMTGSERQVSWARDIIETPYRNLGQRAETAATIARKFEGSGGSAADYRAEETAYRSAQREYARQIDDLFRRAPGGLTAGQVIDRRGVFSDVANRIAQEELRKRRR